MKKGVIKKAGRASFMALVWTSPTSPWGGAPVHPLRPHEPCCRYLARPYPRVGMPAPQARSRCAVVSPPSSIQSYSQEGPSRSAHARGAACSHPRPLTPHHSERHHSRPHSMPAVVGYLRPKCVVVYGPVRHRNPWEPVKVTSHRAHVNGRAYVGRNAAVRASADVCGAENRQWWGSTPVKASAKTQRPKGPRPGKARVTIWIW